MSEEKANAHTLEILTAIEAQSDITQRSLATQLGVALGLTNSYLKKCVRKGYVKISEAPANRYLYYLTPKGFKEKSRLTAEYFSSSLDFYRVASNSMADLIQSCDAAGIDSLILAGVSELAEIATIRALDHGIKVQGTIDSNYAKKNYLGRPIWKSVPATQKTGSVCVYTAIDQDAAFYSELSEFFSERLLVPSVLSPMVLTMAN